MRAVSDEYNKRSMQELADDALEIIKRQPGLRCGGIGDELFPDGTILRGSAPFARIAGKVMRILQTDGRAVYKSQSNDRLGGWYPAIGGD